MLQGEHRDGRGQQNSRWWKVLPGGGLEVLCDLLNLVEARRTWPSAMRLCPVQLAAPQGGHRRPAD